MYVCICIYLHVDQCVHMYVSLPTYVLRLHVYFSDSLYMCLNSFHMCIVVCLSVCPTLFFPFHSNHQVIYT
jgi:hypothetical protein